jgi:hypothetical protein
MKMNATAAHEKIVLSVAMPIDKKTIPMTRKMVDRFLVLL